MTDLWENYPEDQEYDFDEAILSPLAKHTAIGWRHILKLCEREVHFGFGALDSFLSGPDLESRTKLLENEVKSNNWLKLELRDMLGLNQEDWPADISKRLRQAAV